MIDSWYYLEWWQSYSYQNSGSIDRIIIVKNKLDIYTNYDSDIGVTMQSISNKEVMWSKVIGNEEIETTSTMNTRNNMLSPKATVFFPKHYKILVSYQLKMSYQFKIVIKLMKI